MIQFRPIFTDRMCPARASLVTYVVETPKVREASVLDMKLANSAACDDICCTAPRLFADYSTLLLQFGCDGAII